MNGEKRAYDRYGKAMPEIPKRNQRPIFTYSSTLIPPIRNEIEAGSELRH